jgi:hypothetical protein
LRRWNDGSFDIFEKKMKAGGDVMWERGERGWAYYCMLDVV